MSLLDVIKGLDAARYFLYALAFILPVVVYLVGRFAEGAAESRIFGHVASGLIALGFLVIAFDVGVCLYLSKKGIDLFSEVPVLSILAPLWFGLGTLWAACQAVPFADLRQYPLLRRVWAMLTAVAMLIAALYVLKHTFWLVFSGLLGFIVVVLIFWTAFEKVLSRIVGQPESETAKKE